MQVTEEGNFSVKGSTKSEKHTSHVVIGVVVVDFNHLVGPQIEQCYPRSLQDNEELSSQLPFMALPDGSHLSGEDYCYFHLQCKSIQYNTIFGISYNRQIMSSQLINKGSQVTRSMVQKAVVILATQPIFGPMRAKLGMVTRAYFEQRDLSNMQILEEFYDNLEYGLACAMETKNDSKKLDMNNTLYMGTSLRELVYKWRFKVLMLVKLLLLQKRMMFFGYPVEQLCTLQYNLISLIPALLPNLQDAAVPELNTQSEGRTKAESLKMSDRQSLLAYMGLPLPLFSKDAFFQPYCPLQQMDMLNCPSWLIGTTNSIFKHQRTNCPDVVIDVQDPALNNLIALTPADRRWMDELIQVVQDTWNQEDPGQPDQMQYQGSDDYIRGRFEEYIFGVLSAAKYHYIHLNGPDLTAIQSYGEFLDAFCRTRVFQEWHSYTDNTLCDLISRQHPFTGKTNTMSDMALRLQAGLHDLHLEENWAPTKEALSAAFQAGSTSLSKMTSSWYQDLGRLASSHVWSSPRASADGSTEASTEGAAAQSEEGGRSALEVTRERGAHAISQIGTFLTTKQRTWYSAIQGRSSHQKS